MYRPQQTALKLGIAAVAMFAFGFALVPLYDVICDLTGLNGKTGTIEKTAVNKMAVDTTRTVNVEFLVALNQSFAMDFKPMQPKMTAQPGAVNTVSYIAQNRTQRTVLAQAIPSLSPARAAIYFSKIECFCFESQTFGAGEEKQLTMQFVVNPELPVDITTVSLAYTLFDVTEKQN